MSLLSVERTEMDELIAAHYRAEVSGDVPAALATLAAKVEHDVVGSPQVSYGLEEVGPFYHALFSNLALDRISSLRRLYGEDFAVDEAIVDARAIGNPFGIAGHGRAVRFRLLHIFVFQNGLITRENAWLDLAAIQQQLA
jgi:predicted ester cyclase